MDIGMSEKYNIPNLAKACAVIELLGSAPGGLPLREIIARLDIPRTSAIRITQTLLRAGFLAENGQGAYTPGPALVQIGVKAIDRLDITTFARAVLQALSVDTGESTHLAMLCGDKSLLVEVADSPRPVRIASRPGTLVDLHCSATGKVFLAFAIAEPGLFCRQLDLLPHTGKTNTTVDAVLAAIDQTRKQGYAIDEEEYVPGVRCIAAPVVNAFGKTIAAIGITASTSTFTRGRIPAMAKKIKKAAGEISANLGR